MGEIEIINNFFVINSSNQVIRVVPYYENLFISITGVLFFYWLCCALKRDYKEWLKNKREK